MTLLGVAYIISAFLQLLTGLSSALAMSSSEPSEGLDLDEQVSTAQDFTSRASDIPSRARRHYMPDVVRIQKEFSRRYELSLAPFIFLLPSVPFLAAGWIEDATHIVAIILASLVVGGALLLLLRNVKRLPQIFGIGVVTLVSTAANLLLGVFFIVLGSVLGLQTPVSMSDALTQVITWK